MVNELQCRLNPAGYSDEYLANLNVAFGAWGDRELYEWVFDRSCGSHAPDQLVLADGDEALAGSGISYRKLALAGEFVDVGIMTGSWTLPAARGRGCFSRIIRESVDRCAELGCAMLLAFVTHDNPSRYALQKAGAVMFPSRYIFAGPDWGGTGRLETRLADLTSEDLVQMIEADRSRTTHFVYPDVADFHGQFFERAFPTEVVSVGNAVALLERTDSTDRVAAVVLAGEQLEEVYESLAAESARAGRRFFGFWMGDDAPKRLDFTEGFLMAIPAARSELEVVLGRANAGEDEHRWLERTVPRWAIDSGDRM